MSAQLRRKNLEFLVSNYGTQKRLAEALGPSRLTQPVISAILAKGRSKRARFEEHDAREAEKKLGIPDTWLDQYPLQKEVMAKIRELQNQTPEAREILYDLLRFVSENAR